MTELRTSGWLRTVGGTATRLRLVAGSAAGMTELVTYCEQHLGHKTIEWKALRVVRPTPRSMRSRAT